MSLLKFIILDSVKYISDVLFHTYSDMFDVLSVKLPLKYNSGFKLWASSAADVDARLFLLRKNPNFLLLYSVLLSIFFYFF